MLKLWNKFFLAERPSIGLAFFRLAVAVTVGAHVIPTLIPLADNYYSTAFKELNSSFFTDAFLSLVQKSPDSLVSCVVALFLVSWFFFFIGLWTQISCILMTLCCYYFYALNAFMIGTLSWDILLVTLFLMCVSPYPGDYFSLDCLRAKDVSPWGKTRPFFVQRLLQMQIACTYFYTALYKISANGNWLTGNPIYYLMNNPPAGVIKDFMFKEFLASHPGLCYGIGLLIVGMELIMPVLLVCPKTRISAIYAGVVFHVMLILTMDVPAIFFFLFPAQLLLFVAPEDVVKWIENKREYNRVAKRSRLVYDGHCRFCQASVRKIKILDLFDTLECVDYQKFADPSKLHPSLTRAAAHSQLHLIEPDETLWGGFGVFRRICFTLPMLWALIPVIYFPGMGLIGPGIYRWVAKNRYLFHRNKICTDNACFR